MLSYSESWAQPIKVESMVIPYPIDIPIALKWALAG